MADSTSWIVARRSPAGRWDVLPRVFEEQEARDYAAHLPPDLTVVGFDLDTLSSSLPVVDLRGAKA